MPQRASSNAYESYPSCLWNSIEKQSCRARPLQISTASADRGRTRRWTAAEAGKWRVYSLTVTCLQGRTVALRTIFSLTNSALVITVNPFRHCNRERRDLLHDKDDSSLFPRYLQPLTPYISICPFAL